MSHIQKTSLVLAWLASLAGCASPKLLTVDQMRDAVYHDRARDIRRSLKAGFKVDQDVAFCFPVISLAALMNRAEIVTVILDYHPQEISRQSCQGQTPLHYAYLTDNESLKQLLLSRGANGDIADANGRRPHDLSPPPAEQLH